MALVSMFATIFLVELYSNWIVFAFTVTDIVILNVYVLGLKMMNWIINKWQAPLAIGKCEWTQVHLESYEATRLF
jgi:hypothetical protein